jgi:hypothetical protein
MTNYINKIMVDSRFKTAGSQSNSNFSVEVSDNVNLPDYTGAMVTDVVLPRTWYNITNYNNSFYFRTYTNNNLNFNDYYFAIPPQNYSILTLATALKNAMTLKTGKFFDLITNIDTGRITFNIVSPDVTGLRVFNNDELKTRVGATWNGDFYNINGLNSINDVIRNYDPSTISDNNNKFSTGVIDLMGIHNIYIKSSVLSNFSNIGPQGERNIISKIITNASYGDVIIYHNYLSEDYVDCSNRSLKILDFQITDVYGREIDLNGSNVTFSILFFSTR